MTFEQFASYGPIFLVVLAAGRMFFQLSKMIAKIDTIDKRMEKIERINITVASLKSQVGERFKSLDRRLEILETGNGRSNFSS